MPYKSSKIKLAPHQDRRRRVSDEQKEEIRKLYEQGAGSHRELAKRFGISKSMVGIIVNPHRANAVKERQKEHWRDYRPSKEEWSAVQKEHRRYKQELYVRGELQDNNTIQEKKESDGE